MVNVTLGQKVCDGTFFNWINAETIATIELLCFYQK